ncbi:unnamed protein product [Calicophoron daubneyi]|uniref:Uncharacterized protein n=1 Tax=Calicophoron daubneyi TaxID=300641 RepID=A0AAV2TL93_CALDB
MEPASKDFSGEENSKCLEPPQPKLDNYSDSFAGRSSVHSLEEGGFGDEESLSIFTDEFIFREKTSDTISSVSILGKRIVRRYASEFILPDDTQVAITRQERADPAENLEEITLSLSIGITLSEQQTAKFTATEHVDDQGTDSGAVTSMSATSSEETQSELSNDTDDDPCNNLQFDPDNTKRTSDTPAKAKSADGRRKPSKCPCGLRIADYMNDDPWASSILVSDGSSNADLLRQLEVGCLTEPDAYRMERVQKRRNLETIIDLHGRPTVRTIGLSRAQSEADSIATACTTVEDDEIAGH